MTATSEFPHSSGPDGSSYYGLLTLCFRLTGAALNQPSINPRSIKPLGNLILSPPNAYAARATSLGKLSVLSDEILLLIFSELSPSDLHHHQAVSRYFFAWCAGLDGLWKPGFISKNNERLSDWKGSWRSSYIWKFMTSVLNQSGDQSLAHGHLPTDLIRTPSVFSDVLFQPILCVNHSIHSIISRLTGSKKFHSSIEKVIIENSKTFQLPNKPAILKGLIDEWPAYSPSSDYRWTLDSLTGRYPNVEFRAESTLTTLSDYREYHDNCMLDESPVYMFDSQFFEKTSTPTFQRGLGEDFVVPEIFQQDLFSCLGDQRPDYRWLIVGPARSGSTWHIDPNGTSAWNAVITRRKYWICFPPHTTPPGVMVNDDESEVESPLSISEWFLNYYDFAKETYGRFSKHPETRGLMLEGICEAGETFFVPSGWWHLVINLESSIAITQNFVSDNELTSVLHFMKHKPDQLSGFKFKNRELTDQASDSDDCLPTMSSDKSSSSIFEGFLTQLSRSKKISDQSLKEVLTSVEQLEIERLQNRSKRLLNTHRQNNGDDDQELLNPQIKKRKNQLGDLSSVDSDFNNYSLWNEIKKPKTSIISDPNNDLMDKDVGDDTHTPLHCHHDKLMDGIGDQDPGGFKFGFDLE
ncbi:hypothetical protein PSTT_02697 [Puccinia striiformis]|uniref:JmjC domain-containing protein n=1 Tax=Puccinia striiformis TaxID=27350 RepID=A0A2S4VZ29_9BASI|nr:hypothetical protein PSTT_02697 [Puccinia striiformis]